MFSPMGQTNPEDFGNGGTIDGDLVITGDLQVSGGGSLSFDEIIEGTQVIDVTSTEALLIRKNGDGGDVFVVDTTNTKVKVKNFLQVGYPSSTGSDNSALYLDKGSSGSSQLFFSRSDGADVDWKMYTDGDESLLIEGVRAGEDLIIKTVPSGGSATERMRIGSDGTVTLTQANANYALNIDQNGNSPAIYIDTEATSQHGIHIASPAITSGTCLNVSSANSLVDGRAAYFHSNSSNTTARNLVEIHNDHADSTGTTVLKLVQDSTGAALVALGNVGIGDSTPTELLEIAGDSDPTLLIRHNTADQASSGKISFRESAGGSTGADLRYDGSANNFIIDTSDVSNALVIARTTGNATLAGTLTVNGDLAEISGAHPTLKLTDSDDSNYATIGYTDGALSIDSNGGNEAGAADTITFLTDGSTARFKIDNNSRISLSNNDTGTSNTIFGKTAGDSDGAGDYNVFVGELAGGTGTQTDACDFNVAIGYNAYTNVTIGTNSTIVGAMAGDAATATQDLTLIGKSAGTAINHTDANGTTAVGTSALESLTSGDGNVAMGYQSATTMTTGAKNVIIGYQAGVAITKGRYTTAIGYRALYTEDVGDESTAVGYGALFSQNSDSDNESTGNTGVGVTAGYYNVTGTGNTYLGYNSGKGASGQSNSNNVGVGSNALLAITNGTHNTALGYYSGVNITTGDDNVMLGKSAGNAFNSSNIVAVGSNSLASITNATADGSVAVGKSALTALTTGANNTAIGFSSMIETTVGNYNTAIGYNTMKQDAGLANLHNTFIGNSVAAGDWTTTASSGNTGVGSGVMQGAMQGALNNTAVGMDALNVITTGDGNIAIGAMALDAADGAETNNIAIGLDSLGNLNSDGATRNIGIGNYSGDGMGTVGNHADNIFIGHDSGGGTWTGTSSNQNTAIGSYSMDAAMNGANYNTAVGYNSLSAVTTGDNNTSLGLSSLNGLIGGSQNTALGSSAGLAITSGNNNVAIGHHALLDIIDGNQNIAIGSFALGGALGGTADGSADNVVIGYNAGSGNWADQDCSNLVAIGSGAMQGALAGNTADGSVAIGKSALAALTSGARNTAVGFQASLALTTGSDNTSLGHTALDELVDGSKNTAIGAYALGEVQGGSTSDGSSHNTALGYNAAGGVWADQDCSNIVAIGSEALSGSLAGDTADGTIAIGKDALKVLTSGAGNLAIGNSALAQHTTGAFNLAIGASALSQTGGTSASTSTGNLAIGKDALGGDWADTGSDHNVAIGYSTLSAALSGAQRNQAMGYKALQANVNGDDNFAFGFESMLEHTSGSRNIAIGSNSMNDTGANDCPTSTDNIFIGHDSGGGTWVTNDSNFNVSVGNYTMDAAMNGALNNTGMGHQSLTALTTGNGNVCSGFQSGVAITTGLHNIGIGYQSCATTTTGDGNVMIGTGSTSSGVDVNDQIVINAGYDSVVSAGTETIKIGVDSDFITNDFGENATWTHSSDKRIKKDIKDCDLGLDFINDLRPVTFVKKAPSEYPKKFDSYNERKTERKSPDRVNYGFIAQEVKASMDKSGHSKFPVWKENTDTMQELGETELITPLVKAIQELTARVKELEKKL